MFGRHCPAPYAGIVHSASRDTRIGAAIGAWFGRCWSRNPFPLDIAVYTACLGYAGLQAATSEFYGFRVWGNCALAGYGIALVHSVRLLLRTRAGRTPAAARHSRWVGIAAVGALAMLLPLVILVVRRLSGGAWQDTPLSWSAQPEVWVIERSANLLLAGGTPYIDISELTRPPGVYDYTPYGPVMSLFGLPDALFASGPLTQALTDARLYFALTALGCVVASLKLLGWPRVPIRGAQLAIVCPLTALTWAVAGPDLAILGLILLAITLAARRMPTASAAVLALAISAKLIALPAAVVLAVLVLATSGAMMCGRFVGTLLAVCAAVNVPIFLVDPDAYLEHVIRFPLGLAAVSSPAASPLPGHLLASTGPAGQVAALVLLFGAGTAVAVWLVRRPPRTAADAALRLAIGLAAFTVFAPATRFGYLVYPTVLLGAMLCYRQSCRESHRESYDDFFLPRVAPPRPRNCTPDSDSTRCTKP